MPRTANNKPKPPQKGKTVLYIEPDVLESLRYIEYKDKRTRTDILNESLKEYISRWEKKSGPIPK